MKYIFHNFINTLRHYKASSLLNIIGMAVAFAAFYIILTQVKWGFTYNQEVEDADGIFVMSMPSRQIAGKQTVFFSRPLAEQILSSASGVESYGTAGFYIDADAPFYYIKDGDRIRKVSTFAQQFTKGAVSVFGFEAEQGTFDDFSKPNVLAVSSEFARANNLKVGDYLSYSPTGEPLCGEIVAIWKDKEQKNSGPGSIDMISNLGNQYIDDWEETGFPYFVKLKKAGDVVTFEKSATGIIRKALEEECGGDQERVNSALAQFKIRLLPFKDVYYSTCIDNKISISLSGNRTTDMSLLVVAILIILIALINFINFFFALIPSRVRSVNTYKVFGTSRTTLVRNFILESVGLVILALILAALIVHMFSKAVGTEVLNAPIGIAPNCDVMMLTIIAALAGAVISSLAPAFYITSFQPALVLKGYFGTSRAGRNLRNLLIGVQFAISITLIICAMFVRLQHNYMMNYDMGFNKECLISGQMPSGICWLGDKNEAFENKLRSNPEIVDITWADGQIVNVSRMGWGRTYKGNEIEFQCYPVAYNFLDVMKIEMAEGRKFTKADELGENGVLIFNEEAKKQYGISLGVGCPGPQDIPTEIVGICKDFHFKPLQHANYPFAFYIFGKDHSWRPDGLRYIYVRIATGADPGKVMEFIRNTVLELRPDVDPDTIELHLFNEELANKYKTEDRLSKQITAFTVVAIVLALMGVFGLVLFETQHRRKEIAIRRVLGAEVNDILKMLCRKYAAIVLVCYAIATPVSWLVIDRYLSTFAYHTAITWWVFAVALIIVLIVTVSIVIVRCWSAATSNPVEAIKTE